MFNLNATSAYLDWADSLRADRYRVWVQTLGSAAGFVALESVTESDYMFTGLRSGTTLVQVTAINVAGESQPSATIDIRVA